MNCPHCNRKNEDHFNFCLGCGANLQEADVPTQSMACAQCGAPVPKTHGFCGSCGARIHRPTANPQAVEDEQDGESEDGEESNARLVLINPDGSTGETIVLKQGDNVFGRDSGPDVVREDPFLSPEHACFKLAGTDLQVVDLDSLNGVYFRIVESVEIQHEDHIRVGRQLLHFQLLDEAEPVFAAADDTEVLGSPIGDAWGRLVRVSNPGVSSTAFLLRGIDEVIGRERGAVIFADDGFVSARHARITVDAGHCFLEDLRSSNGTFLRVRTARRINHGDLVLMGQQPMRAFLGG